MKTLENQFRESKKKFFDDLNVDVTRIHNKVFSALDKSAKKLRVQKLVAVATFTIIISVSALAAPKLINSFGTKNGTHNSSFPPTIVERNQLHSTSESGIQETSPDVSNPNLMIRKNRLTVHNKDGLLVVENKFDKAELTFSAEVINYVGEKQFYAWIQSIPMEQLNITNFKKHFNITDEDYKKIEKDEL